MSDTPRTDATQAKWKTEIRTPQEVWDFARQLERENAKMREELARLRENNASRRDH